MDNKDKELIARGTKDFNSLSVAEQEMFSILRKEYLSKLYGEMPIDVRNNIETHIETLNPMSVQFYEGFIAAMEWYRDFIRHSLHPQISEYVDSFHIPLFIVMNHKREDAIQQGKSSLEKLFKLDIDENGEM